MSSSSMLSLSVVRLLPLLEQEERLLLWVGPSVVVLSVLVLGVGSSVVVLGIVGWEVRMLSVLLGVLGTSMVVVMGVTISCVVSVLLVAILLVKLGSVDMVVYARGSSVSVIIWIHVTSVLYCVSNVRSLENKSFLMAWLLMFVKWNTRFFPFAFLSIS